MSTDSGSFGTPSSNLLGSNGTHDANMETIADGDISRKDSSLTVDQAQVGIAEVEKARGITPQLNLNFGSATKELPLSAGGNSTKVRNLPVTTAGASTGSSKASRVRSADHATLGQMAEQIQQNAKAELAKTGAGDGYDGPVEDYKTLGMDDEYAGVCMPGNESTGRWTRQEHEAFLEALKKYGKVSSLRHAPI